MRLRTSAVFLSLVVIAAALPGCERSDAAAREPAARAASADELEPTGKTIFGERLLLYLEHPHLVGGEPARFLAHLSVLADGEPVRSGRISLEIGATRLSVEAPKRDGLFVAEGTLAAGRFPGRLAVASDQAAETLELGEFVVHANRDEARRAAEAEAGSEPPDAVPFVMEAQWKVKLLVAEAKPRSLVRRLTVQGQARLPEGAEARVAPPVAGRLVAPASGRLPLSGEQVEAGQELASVEPSLGAPELAQLRALALEFDLKALEVARATGDAKARLDFATRELERVMKLRERGLGTQQQLEAAERDLSLARIESESAQATKFALDRLMAERAARGDPGGGSPLRFPLLAPIRGTVAAGGRVAGEAVGPGDELLRILDTSRIWVEARLFEFDLPKIAGEVEAAATFAALPGARFEAFGPAAGRRLWIGPVIDAASRTALVRCELDNRDGRIRAGMLAELELGVEKVEAAVAIPAEAVVLDSGLATAYVMVEGELFQKRDLELGIRDGGLVEVRRGVAAGERVATRGAHAVKLATLSPASFGPGHQH